MTTASFNAKYPQESRILTLNGTADLASGETLVQILSTTVSVVRGIDQAISLSIAQQQINATQLSVNSAGVSIVMATGTAIQAIASGGTDGVWYLIEFLCETSTTGKNIVLAGILPVSSLA